MQRVPRKKKEAPTIRSFLGTSFCFWAGFGLCPGTHPRSFALCLYQRERRSIASSLFLSTRITRAFRRENGATGKEPLSAKVSVLEGAQSHARVGVFRTSSYVGLIQERRRVQLSRTIHQQTKLPNEPTPLFQSSVRFSMRNSSNIDLSASSDLFEVIRVELICPVTASDT